MPRGAQEALWEAFQDVGSTRKLVKLQQFHKFAATAEAVQSATALVEGKLSAGMMMEYADEHGDFKDICKVIEQDFFEQLNWKLESDLRKTPVWKSSVREILYSNARFRHNLPAADKNIFTFSAYA